LFSVLINLTNHAGGFHSCISFILTEIPAVDPPGAGVFGMWFCCEGGK